MFPQTAVPRGEMPSRHPLTQACFSGWSGVGSGVMSGFANGIAWKLHRVHSFLDYIMGGCQIHCTVSPWSCHPCCPQPAGWDCFQTPELQPMKEGMQEFRTSLGPPSHGNFQDLPSIKL